MAEVTTNFRDSNQGDLGKNLVSREYLISVYPKLASQLLTSGLLVIGGLPSLFPTQISPTIPSSIFNGFNNWRSISLGSQQQNAASEFHIVKNNGTLWQWFSSSTVTVTRNALKSSNYSSLTQEWTSATNWKQVSVGYYNSAAIKTDGTLWQWGSNYSGSIPRVTFFGTISSPVRELTSSTNWKQVYVGGSSIAAIKTDGSLWAWGDNIMDGMLPFKSTYTFNPLTGTFSGTRYHSSPVRIGTSNDWDSIIGLTYQRSPSFSQQKDGFGFAGSRINCALKGDGSLWTWGVMPGPGILRVPGYIKMTPISFNMATSYTWKTLPSTLQVENNGLQVVGESTIALRNDGTMWAFGNSERENGVGLSPIRYKNPIFTTFNQEWTSSTNWKQISRGLGNTLAIKTDGSLWYAGKNYNQADLSGTPTASFVTFHTFSRIGVDSDWKQVSGGGNFAAGVKINGSLWTWGSRGNVGAVGTLTFGATSALSSPTQEFTSALNWRHVSCGGGFGLAIKTDGTMWGWGINQYGQLGVNDLVGRTTLTQEFTSSTNWVQVSCARDYAAAIKTDGSLWCWGRNSYGGLGVNGGSRVTPSREFTSSNNWKYVSCNNNFHTAAIKTDGSLWSWGYNIYGQLGVNDLENRPTPVREFSSSTNWNHVESGLDSTIAITNSGILWGWGFNGTGAVGSNDYVRNYVFSPVREWTSSIWKTVKAHMGSSQGINISTAEIVGIKNNGTLWSFNHSISSVANYFSTIPINQFNVPVGTIQNIQGSCWTKVFCGLNNQAAIKTDGTLWQWGRTPFGGSGPAGRFFYGYTLPSNSYITMTSPVQEGSRSNKWKDLVVGGLTIGVLSDPE